MTRAHVAVTGIGLALPGVAKLADLLRDTPGGGAAIDPAERLGRRGLRYKDRATQLALCAADAAVREAGLLHDGELTVPGSSTGVVASSNLGNADTVCDAAATIAAETVHGLSPMDLPNASSNVVASCVAIQYGLTGANLMVCNGATSGLDAVYWAATLVAAGRVARAVLIGVEPRNEITDRLTSNHAAPLVDGAVALVVEDAAAARQRGATISAYLGPYTRATDVGSGLDTLLDAADAQPGIWFVSNGHGNRRGVEEQHESPPPRPPRLASIPQHSLSATFGNASGALGLLQCAAAVAWLLANDAGSALVSAGTAADDATASMIISSGSSQAGQPVAAGGTR